MNALTLNENVILTATTELQLAVFDAEAQTRVARLLGKITPESVEARGKLIAETPIGTMYRLRAGKMRVLVSVADGLATVVGFGTRR